MFVKAAEFAQDFEKYLAMTREEDVFITRDGKVIAKLLGPRKTVAESLRGLLNCDSWTEGKC